MTKEIVLSCIKNKDKIIMSFEIISLNLNPTIHKHAKINKRISYANCIFQKSSFRNMEKEEFKMAWALAKP
jgi:hypothetical protein